MKAGDPAFGRPFLRSGFSGFYLRVLEGGRGGGRQRHRPHVADRGEGGMTVREILALLDDAADAEDLDRGAALADLALGWRTQFANRAIARRRISARGG